jgi:hypothetical protein
MWPFTNGKTEPGISVADAQELIRAKEVALGRQPRVWDLKSDTRDFLTFDSDEDMGSEAIVNRETGAVTIFYED